MARASGSSSEGKGLSVPGMNSPNAWDHSAGDTRFGPPPTIRLAASLITTNWPVVSATTTPSGMLRITDRIRSASAWRTRPRARPRNERARARKSS